jgi:hypothetical protein
MCGVISAAPDTLAPRLRVDAFDPESNNIEPVVIPVDLDRYILAYYEPFVAAIDVGGVMDDDLSSRIVSVQFQSLRLRVGLLRSKEQRVRSAIQGELDGLGAEVLSLLTSVQLAPGFSDGTLVQAEWEEFLTLNDWEY